jgi:hypothetical protein
MLGDEGDTSDYFTAVRRLEVVAEACRHVVKRRLTSTPRTMRCTDEGHAGCSVIRAAQWSHL